METKGILYLSNNDVKKVLDLGRAIEITEQALRDHSEGSRVSATYEGEIPRLRLGMTVAQQSPRGEAIISPAAIS